ncbi:hypothetical protein GF325_01450, partial [Candidatus Bathyarchaeota archaeon]|nr:hypothetical protein [Candidatus Bathyarchaeota archaeon]
MKLESKKKAHFFLITSAMLLTTVAASLYTGIEWMEKRTEDIGPESLEMPISSDLPGSYTPTFEGDTSSGTLTAGFTNLTTTDITITISNSESNDAREAFLDLSTHGINGFSIYRVDANVTGNEVTAIDDWMIVEDSSELADRHITANSSGAEYQMFAQEIDETMRYELKELSMDYLTLTLDSGVSDPAVELWNATSGTGEPDTMAWTTSIQQSNSTRAWRHHSPGYTINASHSSNNTWFAVLNGTAWGLDPDNADPFNRLRWYRRGISNGGWTKTYGSGWFQEPTVFFLKYKRLYLNDSNDNNRTFTPAGSYLRMNNSLFDANGRISLAGTNITNLTFTTNTTSMEFDVSLKLYYKKEVATRRSFTSDGSSRINWNITANDNVTFPSGTKFDTEINLTKPSTWDVLGIYHAADIASLGSASNYTQYTVNGNAIQIEGVTTSDTWQVRCDSNNQVNSITKTVGGTPVQNVNVTNVVSFSSTLTSSQSGGNLSLCIYYPSNRNDSLVFSSSNASFGGSVTDVELPDDWTISENVPGVFRIQARWNDTESVGFIDESFILFGAMDVNLNSMQQYGNTLSFTNSTENFEQFNMGDEIHSSSDDWDLITAGDYDFNATYRNGSMKGYFVDNDNLNDGHARYYFPSDAPNTSGNHEIKLDFSIESTNFYIQVYDSDGVRINIWVHPSVNRIYTLNDTTWVFFDNFMWETGVEHTLSIHTVGNNQHYITFDGTVYDNSGSYYVNMNAFTSEIDRLHFYSGASMAKFYLDDISTSWSNPSRYAANYGDDITADYSISDTNDAAPISNLEYSFEINGSLENQGTDSTGSITELLDFDTRSTGSYPVIVQFNRTYYHNYSESLIMAIDACPADVSLINISQAANPLYTNGSGVYFANSDSNVTVALNYTNLLSSSLVPGGNGNITDTSNHYLNTSTSGIYLIDVRPTDLTPASEIHFLGIIKKQYYHVSNISFNLVVDSNDPNTTIDYDAAHAPNYVNNTTEFTLGFSDGAGESGVASTEYRLNGGSWTPYGAPFDLSSLSNGSVTIDYRSTDNVGNQEAFGTLLV